MHCNQIIHRRVFHPDRWRIITRSGAFMMRLFVLVGGPPASGKSTLARALAPALDLPLIAKDTIKNGLMDALGDPTELERSRQLGRAAVLALLAVAKENRGAVLDSTWYRYTLPLLRNLPSPVVEVRCTCPPEVARERYGQRMPQRRSGDLQALRPPEELADPAHSEPLGVGPLVSIDTTGEVDIDAVVAALLHAQRPGGKAQV